MKLNMITYEQMYKPSRVSPDCRRKLELLESPPVSVDGEGNGRAREWEGERGPNGGNIWGDSDEASDCVPRGDFDHISDLSASPGRYLQGCYWN